MGASKKIKMVLLDKDMKKKDFAAMLGYEGQNTIYNMLGRDKMSYEAVEKWLDALGCDIVFRDRETGKIYE